MDFKVFLAVLIALSCWWDVDGAKTRSSSSRRATTRRPSPSRNVNTTPYYRSNAATQGYNRGGYSTPGKSSHQVTTPRYNFQTHATVRTYPQQTYNQPKPGYNQPRPGYNQPNYNQPRPGYNQGNYNPYGGGYHQPNFGYNPQSYGGSWYKRKDHSTRNAVLAGLGGSALGLYLGYKLGGLSNNMNSPFHSSYPGYPSYSVVHHYHHGDKPIPKESNLEAKVVKACENIGDFCTNNTTPLCLTNGTIYCMTPLDKTVSCKLNETDYKCVNSSILVPCDENQPDSNCTKPSTISIPCITTINIFGDFATNSLTIHKISKREVDNTTETTTVTTTTTTQMIMVNDSPQESSSSLSQSGINNKFCVTIIADPVKPPEITNNIEYLQYLEANPEEKKHVDDKVGDAFSSVLNYIFY